MKKHNCNKWLSILALLVISVTNAQEQEKPELLVDVGYYMPHSRIPYVVVYTKTKIGKKFQPVPEISLNIYLDSVQNQIGEVKTDINGQARIGLTPALKEHWDASATHNLIVVSVPTPMFEEVSTEISVTKSKLLIDTVAEAETRTVKVQVLAMNGAEWFPVKDVELKLAVKRMGGDLPISEEELYTTDSTGEVIAEFKRDGLPGDTLGNITLVAKVEDNEALGNLSIETILPWGIALPSDHKLQARTLWATGDKAPVWLLFMAGFIIFIVWGTIVYLIVQLIRIRRLGIANKSEMQ